LPNPSAFSPEYLQLWFRANYNRLRAMTENRGGNQPNLNGVLLRQLIIPVPPVDVQYHIAERVSTRLVATKTLVDAVRAEYSAIAAIPSALLRTALDGIS